MRYTAANWWHGSAPVWLLAAFIAVGLAAEPEEQPETAAAELVEAPADALARARDMYVLGDPDGASVELDRIIARDAIHHDVPASVYAEAMIFLGEIHLTNGDRAGAEALLRAVLRRDPSTPISPYDHPDNVIGVFEQLRASVVAEQQRAPVVRSPMPAWGYAPLGIPQFGQGRPARGAVAATLQLGFAGLSIGSWVWITEQRRRYEDVVDLPDDAADIHQRARLIRSAVSVPSAALFYVTWAGSVIDAGRTWRADAHEPRLPTVGVGLAPSADGLAVVVGGAW